MAKAGYRVLTKAGCRVLMQEMQPTVVGRGVESKPERMDPMPFKNPRLRRVVCFENPPVSRVERGAEGCGKKWLLRRKLRGCTQKTAAENVEPSTSIEDVVSPGCPARLALAEVRSKAALLETTPEKTAASRIYGRDTGLRPMV